MLQIFMWVSGISLLILGPQLAAQAPLAQSEDASTVRYLDSNDGHDWPGYGRSFGEQHYSPLGLINSSNIKRLGLAWWLELGPESSATQPVEVDGVLYFATGYSIIHAVDAVHGALLWQYDPRAAERAGLNLRLGWGSRGIAWWDGKIYTGTQDGRLIAIDAKTGKPIWSVQTLEPGMPAYITGAPRVFHGKVVIGFASDTGVARGYVTAYDAETGHRLWRFYTVPGNPASGFENRAMRKAAKTWAGKWWRWGGGGTVWNAMAYDPDTDTLYIGTGNGYPVNRKVRSEGRGDNLFIASIVALNASTGEYKWHYQVNPGESWDYDATMDIELADLTIGGKRRKVLLQAPKNGFFYVIDRTTGQLISAKPFTKVTWASRIDLKTGRPVEAATAQFPDHTVAHIRPDGGSGAHGWQPMAFSPASGLVYVPVQNSGVTVWDFDIDIKHWKPPTDRSFDRSESLDDEGGTSAALLAWDPVAQRAAWSVAYPTTVNGGAMATAGGLVFQGTVDGTFKAYSATNGEVLWSFKAATPLFAPPISYSVAGTQYVTVLSGLGTQSALVDTQAEADQYRTEPHSQARRVLTFALGGNAQEPPSHASSPPVDDPEFTPDKASARRGGLLYNSHCGWCHGGGAVASIHAPDLRRSAIPLSPASFAAVVHEGGLVAQGMPAFGEFSPQQLDDLRQFIRRAANDLRMQQRENKHP